MGVTRQSLTVGLAGTENPPRWAFAIAPCDLPFLQLSLPIKWPIRRRIKIVPGENGVLSRATLRGTGISINEMVA
jgi:hypothetical protein